MEELASILAVTLERGSARMWHLDPAYCIAMLQASTTLWEEEEPDTDTLVRSCKLQYLFSNC